MCRAHLDNIGTAPTPPYHRLLRTWNMDSYLQRVQQLVISIKLTGKQTSSCLDNYLPAEFSSNLHLTCCPPLLP